MATLWKGLVHNPIVDFARHVIVAVAVFLLIAVGAVAIDGVVEWLKTHHYSQLTVAILGYAAPVILIIDLLCLVAYLLKKAVEILRPPGPPPLPSAQSGSGV